MGTRASERSCRQCETHLARDNVDHLCATCRRRARDVLIRPPEVPAWFWDAPEMRAALASRHMGRVVHAFRTHAYHGRSISQSVTASWFFLTQTQLSRIESGPPVQN